MFSTRFLGCLRKICFFILFFSATEKCVSESYAPLNFHRLVYGPSIDFVGFKKPQGFVYIATYILSICYYTVAIIIGQKKSISFVLFFFQIKHNTHIRYTYTLYCVLAVHEQFQITEQFYNNITSRQIPYSTINRLYFVHT